MKAIDDEQPNCPAFFKALYDLTPDLLGDVDRIIRDSLVEEIRATNYGWEEVSAVLRSEWSSGAPDAVRSDMAVWRDEVLTRASDIFPDLFRSVGASERELAECKEAIAAIRPRLTDKDVEQLVVAASNSQD